MKTLILATLAAGLGLTANAQSAYGHDRDYRDFSGHRYEQRIDRYPSGWERHQRIDAINREYDHRIAMVREDRYRRPRERRREIRQLEHQRAMALRQGRRGYYSRYATGY